MSTESSERFRAFPDRRSAGVALGVALRRSRLADPVVIALPRGGVPVALEVATALDAPLDILPVRKIGMPGNPEYAIGAVAAGGVEVHADMADTFTRAEFAELAKPAHVELARRERAYRRGGEALALAGRTAIVVDDGLATGLTMLAAVRAIRHARPARIVVAVPVASHEALDLLRNDSDEVLALVLPSSLRAIGEWYEEFDQLDDAEVLRLLKLAPQPASRG